MKTLTFSEWRAHWGDERLAEITESSQAAYKRDWDERDDPIGLWSFPAWELRLGTYWQESLDEWHSRWERCGGRLSGGRMIAAKWDGIWSRLSSTFYDGFGRPYPPYASSSCACWADIGQDEAIVTGAIPESEFREYMSRFPREPLMDKEGNPISRNLLTAAHAELEEKINKMGGPRPGATREERVEHERKRREESFSRMQAEYKQRNLEQNREREEKNAAFRLLEQVEASLRDAPTVEDPRRWEWLCASLKTLTATTHFDRYPNWQARVWVSCAELHRLQGDPTSELSSLEYALSIDSKLPVKRQIKKLKSEHGSA